tara:strand:- start:18 stop:674 length:657 start_codon:yes stop_codon:yes gene_type:complete
MSNQITIDNKLLKYLQQTGYREDEIINNLVKETQSLGKVAKMQIAPEQGQFLEILVKVSNAKKCLEIGRFTGLSTLCMAKGLPEEGKIVTIDSSDEYLDLSKKYWSLAGVEKKIDSIIGMGVEVMQSMIDRQNYFDLIFIDADKNNYSNYYELSLQLISHKGIILIDNMLWHGDVAEKNIQDESTRTIRALNLKVQKDQRIDYTLLPLSDGILFIVKK